MSRVTSAAPVWRTYARRAARRRAVSDPVASHIAARRSAKTVPPPPLMNRSPACVWHNQIDTPCVRCTSRRGCGPVRAQIEHGGPPPSAGAVGRDPTSPRSRAITPHPTTPAASDPSTAMHRLCPIILLQRTTQVCHLCHDSVSFHVTIGRRDPRQVAFHPLLRVRRCGGNGGVRPSSSRGRWAPASPVGRSFRGGGGHGVQEVDRRRRTSWICRDDSSWKTARSC